MITEHTCQVCLVADCVFRVFCDDDAFTEQPKQFWPNLTVEAA